jgi:hypothetical protein
MNKINLWKEETKTIRVKGNRTLGENVIIISPDEIVSKESGDEDLRKKENWKKTITLSVFLCTWMEIHRSGDFFEKTKKEYYTTMAELQSGYRGKSLSFLRRENLLYKDRFLLLEDNNKQDYIYDNERKKLITLKTKINDFKSFKEILKKEKLI